MSKAELVWGYGTNEGHLMLYAKSYDRQTYKEKFITLGRVINIEKDTLFADKRHKKGYCVQVMTSKGSFGRLGYFDKQGEAKSTLIDTLDWFVNVLEDDDKVWGNTK